MPIIDLKSTLSEFGRTLKTEAATYSKARNDDRIRLLKFLNSPQGVLFAAKQAALSPTTAPQRLAGILSQIVVGQPGVHIRSVFNEPDTTVDFNLKNNVPKLKNLEREIQPDSIQSKYYVKSPIDNQRYIPAEYDRLRDLDIVPFYFTVLETEGGDVRPMYHLAFRSFFSSISDSTNNSYSSYNFIGRGENFHTYQSYTRTSNLNFKVAAFSKEELDVLHDKVDNLRRLAAPKYRGGYMQGNFVNLTVGSYFYNMPGFVTAVTVNINENYLWEIEDRSIIMPQMMDITVAYTVLEPETPQLPFRDPNPTVVAAKGANVPQPQGATRLAPVFAPETPQASPTPQNFTADFSNRQSVGGVFLDDLFNSYE